MKARLWRQRTSTNQPGTVGAEKSEHCAAICQIQRYHQVLPGSGVDGMVRQLDVQFRPVGRLREVSDADSVRHTTDTLGAAVQPTVAGQMFGRTQVVVAQPQPLSERKTELEKALPVLLELLGRGFWLAPVDERFEVGVQLLVLLQERTEFGPDPPELIRPHAVMIAESSA